jgi:hypothetical protein
MKKSQMNQMPSWFSDYADRILNPSLVAIDEQHKAQIDGHNAHVINCQASFTAIKNNTDKILESVEQAKEQIGLIVIKSNVVHTVVEKPVVPVVTPVVIPVVEEVVVGDALFSLMPAVDDKADVEKMKADLSAILKKYNIENMEDVQWEDLDWVTDYGSFMKDCKYNKYKKNWFRRIF